MNKVKLYTAVPFHRLNSIANYGLLPNDKLMEVLNENQTYPELRGRIFEESDFGYIYASKNLASALEWGNAIQMMTNDYFAILSYEVEEELIKLDFSSSNHDLSDCKFNKVINPNNITFIIGEIYSQDEKTIFKMQDMPFLEFFEVTAKYSKDEQKALMKKFLKIKVTLDKQANVLYI